MPPPPTRLISLARSKLRHLFRAMSTSSIGVGGGASVLSTSEVRKTGLSTYRARGGRTSSDMRTRRSSKTDVRSLVLLNPISRWGIVHADAFSARVRRGTAAKRSDFVSLENNSFHFALRSASE